MVFKSICTAKYTLHKKKNHVVPTCTKRGGVWTWFPVPGLMFVMTTCLAVYSILEYRIRQSLQKTGTTVPDQKGKPTSNPTAWWVFQLFVDIHVLNLPDGQRVVMNLKPVHRDVLTLLSYQNYYS